MPDTPWFHNWGFNFRDMTESVKAIPNDIDILVSHGPPFGILDQTHPGGEHLGCKELMGRLVGGLSPKLCVFGHIHGGYGQAGGFVNASICDEKYRPVNKPIVIEL
jgi:Icc-related predicted phosphoesterase